MKVGRWFLLLSALALSVMWLATGCRANYRDMIQSPEPGSRVRAIIRAADRSDRVAIPLIIDRLDDEDEAVRVIAIMALKKLTGQDLGYRAFDPLGRRIEAVERWRRWLKDGKIPDVTTRPVATRSSGGGVSGGMK